MSAFEVVEKMEGLEMMLPQGEWGVSVKDGKCHLMYGPLVVLQVDASPSAYRDMFDYVAAATINAETFCQEYRHAGASALREAAEELHSHRLKFRQGATSPEYELFIKDPVGWLEREAEHLESAGTSWRSQYDFLTASFVASQHEVDTLKAELVALRKVYEDSQVPA